MKYLLFLASSVTTAFDLTGYSLNSNDILLSKNPISNYQSSSINAPAVDCARAPIHSKADFSN